MSVGDVSVSRQEGEEDVMNGRERGEQERAS